MPRARRGQFMVKLESDTEVYFQAQAAPASGYAELEFHFPECPETDNCKEIRTLSKDNSDIWRGSLAWSSWTWVPPSGWTPVAQARPQTDASAVASGTDVAPQVAKGPLHVMVNALSHGTAGANAAPGTPAGLEHGHAVGSPTTSAEKLTNIWTASGSIGTSQTAGAVGLHVAEHRKGPMKSASASQQSQDSAMGLGRRGAVNMRSTEGARGPPGLTPSVLHHAQGAQDCTADQECLDEEEVEDESPDENEAEAISAMMMIRDTGDSKETTS